MKKRTSFLIHIGALVVILVGILFLISDSSHIFKAPGYDATAPTDTKMAQLARWIPAGADFFVAADVPKALANQELAASLTRVAEGRSGVVAYLISALMEEPGSIGLLCVLGRLGEMRSRSEIALLAQGGFDEETLLPAVRSAMSAGHSGVAAQNLEWTTIYTESDSRDPFGFMFLDGTHLAAGDRASLLAMYEKKPEPTKVQMVAKDQTIVGYIAIGERLRRSAPEEMYLPDAAYITSPDGTLVTVRIPCDDDEKAQSVMMLLEGIRSLMTIQQEPKGDGGLGAVLGGMTMKATDGDVVIEAKLASLIDLWVGGEGKTPPQSPQAPEGR